MAINKVFYRSPHNYDVDQASNECSVKDFGPSLTVQSQAEDVDLNVIMKRFGVTGQMPPAAAIEPIYGDFTEVVDFRTAQHRVIEARDAFNALPPGIRARFGNDPQEFLNFAVDPANLEGMREMGLAPPKPRGDGNVSGPGQDVGGAGAPSGGGSGGNAPPAGSGQANAPGGPQAGGPGGGRSGAV